MYEVSTSDILVAISDYEQSYSTYDAPDNYDYQGGDMMRIN